jgi:hypothetical protein
MPLPAVQSWHGTPIAPQEASIPPERHVSPASLATQQPVQLAASEHEQ